MKRLFSLICSLSLLVQCVPSLAQTEFRKALQTKHNLKTVSCFTCHERKANVPEDKLEAYAENAKSFRNAFGKEFDKLLKGKDITKRLKDAKKLPTTDPDRKKVIIEVTKEFLEALKKVEAQKSPSEVTYGELLKSGTLDGVKPK